MDIAKPIAKKFSDSILCYLRLWRYLTRRSRSVGGIGPIAWLGGSILLPKFMSIKA
jgi:hypothetical protein